MKTLNWLIFFMVFGTALSAQAETLFAKPEWSELRLFGFSRGLSSSPASLNALTSGDSVNSLANLTGLGFEVDARVWQMIKIGGRYANTWTEMTANNPSTPPSAFLAVQQTQVGVVLRASLIELDSLYLEVFGEAGSDTSHLDIKTSSSGAGTWTGPSLPYERAGATVGTGWKYAFVFVEVAQEWNRLDRLSFAGTLTNTISSVDFSGTYVGVGIIFRNIPKWFKSSGSSSSSSSSAK